MNLHERFQSGPMRSTERTELPLLVVHDTHTLGSVVGLHKTVCYCTSEGDAKLVAEALNKFYAEPA